MRLLRAFTVLQAMVLAGFILVAMPAQAGTEATYSDQCKFHMGYYIVQQAYIVGTTDNPESEIATFDFMVEFDVVHSGTLTSAAVQFKYDPDELTLLGAVPAAGWGTVGVNDTTLRVTTGELNEAVYTITTGSSSIPMNTDANLVAQFKFLLNCQSTENVDTVLVVHGVNKTWVASGSNYYIIENPGPPSNPRINHGRVSPREYWWIIQPATTDGTQLDFPGALGTSIYVPMYFWTNFRAGDVDMYVTYINTQLAWAGGTSVDSLATNFTGATAAISSPGVIHIHLSTNENIQSRSEFDPRQRAFALKFNVLGSWQGGNTTIGFQGDPTMEIAQESGTCTAAAMDVYLQVGYVGIPAYTARYTSSFPDTQGSNVSIADNTATIQVNLTNNYPAGKTRSDDDPYLASNLKLETGLTPTLQNPPNFYLWASGDETGYDVSLRLKNTGIFFDASATPDSVTSFTVTAAAPTSFDNHLYTIRYQSPYDGLSSAFARVRDTANKFTATWANQKLTGDTTQINYQMGEYYCPGVEGGQGLIAQSYYIRNSFAVHDFRVKISVSGAHSMYDIALEPGVVVEELDSSSFKWIIIKSGEDWVDQAATDSRVKFATITYAYWTQNHMLELSQPGPGGGYWVTKTSEVLFVFDQPSGFFMNDPADVDQHEVELSGGLVSRWFVYPPDPQRDLVSPGSLPTEYALLQNYPNPFNPTTAFWYALPEGAWVEVSVYNITGQKVATVSEGWREAGFYNATWDGSDVASGVYFYRIVTDKFTESKKMILLK